MVEELRGQCALECGCAGARVLVHLVLEVEAPGEARLYHLHGPYCQLWTQGRKAGQIYVLHKYEFISKHQPEEIQ